MRRAMGLATMAMAVVWAGCGRPAVDPRGELAFAAPRDAARGCVPSGVSRVASRVLARHPGARLASMPEGGARADMPGAAPAVRAWAVDRRLVWSGRGGSHALSAASPEGEVAQVSTARVDARRVALAWTEGTVEAGYRVRILLLTDAGEPMGQPLTLGDELGAVMGRPELTFTAAGAGEVMYLASTQEELRLVTTPLLCNEP